MKQADSPILSFFQNNLGFHFDKDKKNRLFSLLASRMKKNGLTREKEYLELICSQAGKKERQFMIAAFTVGETYFFRNTYHWEALKKSILPQILKRKMQHDDKSLRIWSAGCSSGEESYTIAIVLSETITYYQNLNIEILATDLNEASLHHAKKGIYTENAFRETPDDYKEKYFIKNKGKYRIRKQFHEMITFEQLNLIHNNRFPKHYSCFDIIFCRNVLMYFSPEIAKRIVQEMFNALNDDGYLFVGHSEGPITKDFNLKPLSFNNAIVYQKQREPKASFRSEINYKKHFQQEKKVQQYRRVKNVKKEILKDHSSNQIVKNYFDEALHLYTIGKIDNAQQMLNKHHENQTLSSLLLVGLIYIHQKNLDAALIVYKEAKLIYDLTPETHMLGAMIHEEKNNLSEAINGCHRAIFLDQDFFYPHFRLGEMYRKLGDSEKMQKSFNNALKTLHVDRSDRLKLFCAGYSKAFLADYLKSI